MTVEALSPLAPLSEALSFAAMDSPTEIVSQSILVVDDARENIKMLRSLLKDEAEILFATSGEEALAIAATEKPDLILLDIMMPGMDGYEVCRALKTDPETRDIAVIFVTAMTEETDETKGLELGAIDYIAKPFSPAIVRARVRNHLALKRVTRELHLANAELTRLATTDSLTGVANRRYFMERLHQEMDRRLRYRGALGLILLDIDFFKQINDTYGHEVGDTALIALAKSIATTLRSHDVLGRLGGEEFAILLPETSLGEAEEVAERLRQELAALKIDPPDLPGKIEPPLMPPPPKGPVTFTVSLGVTEIGEGDTSVMAFKRVDDALYEAKRTGRNKVVARNTARDA